MPWSAAANRRRRKNPARSSTSTTRAFFLRGCDQLENGQRRCRDSWSSRGSLKFGRQARCPVSESALENSGHEDLGRLGLFSSCAELGQHDRRQRNDRRVRVGQHLIHHAVTGDGSEGRCALRSQYDQIGELGFGLVEEFLCRIAGHYNRLHCNPSLQRTRNQREETHLNLIDGSSREGLRARLWLDDMLQNEARVVLRGKFGGKRGHHIASLLQAYRTQDVSRGKLAVVPIDHFGADYINRNSGGAEDGLSHRAHQHLADGSRRVGAHDDAVDLPLAQESKDLVGGQSWPDHNFASNASVANTLRQRLKMLNLSTGGGGIVVVTDTRGLRCGHDQRVIGVKENEIGAKLGGLSKSKVEGLLVGGNLGSEEDVGGLAPTWLDNGSHGNLLLKVRKYFRRYGIGLRCRSAHDEVI